MPLARFMDGAARHARVAAAATHYSWEISRAPAARESELLEQFRQAFGRLPRLNEAA